jgi:hypothetical protein
VGAALGIAGTLAGVALTLRNANHREDIRWERESTRLQAEAQRQLAEEHAAWLRDQRLESYAELTRLSQDFWMELVPLISVLERQDDDASELNRIRNALFDKIYTCQLIAGAELQVALHQLSDAAENIGHRPYADEPERESAWRHELFKDANDARKRVEEAVRAELNLPPKVAYSVETPSESAD